MWKKRNRRNWTPPCQSDGVADVSAVGASLARCSEAGGVWAEDAPCPGQHCSCSPQDPPALHVSCLEEPLKTSRPGRLQRGPESAPLWKAMVLKGFVFQSVKYRTSAFAFGGSR